MKSCLKRNAWPTPSSQYPPAPSSARRSGSSRKCVAFETESLEQVYLADEWDRSPMEPAGKLSYQDLLELKEIQLSLPRANQPADMIAGRSGKTYLSGVPIGLLPLLPESSSSTSSMSGFSSNSSSSSSLSSNLHSNPTQMHPKCFPSNPYSQSAASPNWPSFSAPQFEKPRLRQHELENQRQQEIERQRQEELRRYHRPAYAVPVPPPPVPPATKPKPRFAFLPLLDSTASSDASNIQSSAPSSQSNAHTHSNFNSHSGFKPHAQAHPNSYFSPPAHSNAHPSSSTPSDLSASMRGMSLNSGNTNSNRGASASMKPRKKKNVMYINGMEIDLDSEEEDSEDEDAAPRTPTGPPPRTSGGPTPITTSNLTQALARSSPSRTSPTSPICSPSPRSLPPKISTTTGLPTPPPSTSPSPTLTQPSPAQVLFSAGSFAGSPPSAKTSESQSPFEGLHAPVRFKRASAGTNPGGYNANTGTSPPASNVSTSPRLRRGSCSKHAASSNPRMSPVMGVRA